MPPVTEILNKVLLFQDLGAEALAILSPLLIAKKYSAGAVIFRELEESDALYIVDQGSVVVSKHVSGDVDMVLTRFQPGDFFGEMGLFDNAPRSATANVEVDSLLWRLDRGVFQDILSHHPEMAAKICYRLVTIFIQRLRVTNEQSRDAIRWGLEATGYSTGSQSLFGRKST
ncbi:MAG: cyclic nucleotide-binding domain-containing protein [Deltaproteobacteria bacterium]|nr:cyclic nucleotide-binding domain-containing protein [Deltaproteobacteria bacterium]